MAKRVIFEEEKGKIKIKLLQEVVFRSLGDPCTFRMLEGVLGSCQRQTIFAPVVADYLRQDGKSLSELINLAHQDKQTLALKP